MIQSIKIEKLYYIYSYEIDFANDANVLILTGPNGFGKTTKIMQQESLKNKTIKGVCWSVSIR